MYFRDTQTNSFISGPVLFHNRVGGNRFFFQRYSFRMWGSIRLCYTVLFPSMGTDSVGERFALVSTTAKLLICCAPDAAGVL